MNEILKKIKIIITQVSIIILNRMFILSLPLKKNRVLFISDNRKELGGNLKYVYDFLPEKYEKVVSIKIDRRERSSIKQFINRVKYISTSKYVLLEDLVQATSHIKVRKGQEVVQLWHGPGAFKKFGYSRVTTDLGKGHIHKGYKKYTKAIVSGSQIRNCYAEAFGMNIENVQATGFPRTDLFFDEQSKNKKIDEIYKKYPFMKDKKVILFAPTYRGTQFRDAHYDIDKLELEKIYNELSNQNYIFIFKWHPFLANNIRLKLKSGYDEYKEHEDFFYDLSTEGDINDLLLVTDILITDYSSVIFDYFFTNKPIIYFTYDLDEYANDRGMYFPFEDYVYGNVAKTNDELLKSIKEQDLELEKREKFKQKFLDACDGKSTLKTYEWIFEDKLN